MYVNIQNGVRLLITPRIKSVYLRQGKWVVRVSRSQMTLTDVADGQMRAEVCFSTYIEHISQTRESLESSLNRHSVVLPELSQMITTGSCPV
jgi:hypothetical protein